MNSPQKPALWIANQVYAQPPDIQYIVQRNVTKFTAAQRNSVRKLNKELETRLAQRGMMFNAADTASFRRALGAVFYQRWQKELGATAWALLENAVGKLG